MSEANIAIERLNNNLNIVTSEKNTLLSIIEQQETAFKVQQTQSENSLKMVTHSLTYSLTHSLTHSLRSIKDKLH